MAHDDIGTLQAELDGVGRCLDDAMLDADPRDGDEPMILRWESAGNDEPGDQNAPSRLWPHAWWSIGPDHPSGWSVVLTFYSDTLEELSAVPLERAASEREAKRAAERFEWLRRPTTNIPLATFCAAAAGGGVLWAMGYALVEWIT